MRALAISPSLPSWWSKLHGRESAEGKNLNNIYKLVNIKLLFILALYFLNDCITLFKGVRFRIYFVIILFYFLFT